MSEIHDNPSVCKDELFAKKENSVLLISTLGLGLLFNLLFYGKPLGVSYPLYIMALYLVLFWNMRNKRPLKVDQKLLMGIPIILLSFSYFLYSNQVFIVLNFMAIPILVVAHTLLLTSNNRYEWFKSQFLGEVIYGMVVRPLENFLKPFYVILAFAKRRPNSGKYRAASKILIGLLAAAGLLMVIIPLLASADDIFRQLLERVPNVFRVININEIVPRLIVVTLVTCLVFSYLWSLLSCKVGLNKGSSDTLSGEVLKTDSLQKSRAFLDPITVTSMLVLIDLLYTIFIAIQFSYLFGSLKFGLPPNFTYSQYARKGFFELVVITLINLIILLGNMNFLKSSGTKLDQVVKLLNTILVASTFIILLSAHFRMSLYEDVYGYTYLRVLTHAFMVYLFVLLAVTLCKIWRQRTQLLKSYLVISIVAYTLINYVNIDNIIVKNNIERYNQGNPIDITYLTTLSYDVVPKLVDLAHSTSDRVLADQLEKGLIYKKQVLAKERPWQSFNISMYRASKALSQQ
ncbi:hypothetical protein DEAC_c05970 [Desulfosporosinus acididurans]|uniref:Uncharacterized protein n=1 Tax=Desulfosporosinus acididurans TaxID=476652 RepID=A0A0J1FVD3_9FIRM|nr:DUF4173 domain-containing protein [Desulfosporosinus acididurans]KLU67385.1 hypothetical protein DEAC_c05970 [Desulfosporosinus acididurans]